MRTFVDGTSDGLTIDVTPPTIEMLQLRLAANTSAPATCLPLGAAQVAFVLEADDEESPLTNVSYCLAPVPSCQGEAMHTLRLGDGGAQLNTSRAAQGKLAFVLNAQVSNALAQTSYASVSHLQLDSGEPQPPRIACSQPWARPGMPLDCSVTAAPQDGSRYDALDVVVGNVPGDDAHGRFAFPPTGGTFRVLFPARLQGAPLHVCASVTGCAGTTSALACVAVVEDRTPPEAGTVRVVSMTLATINASQGALAVDLLPTASCQITTEAVAFVVEGFAEDVSELSHLEVAVGSWPGGADLLAWQPRAVVLGKAVLLDGLEGLTLGQEVFVSVMAVNRVGLSTKAVAESVVLVLSAAGAIRLRDGGFRDTSIASQFSVSEYTANWETTDLCRIVRQEWALYREDGLLVRGYLPLPGDVRFATLDGIRLDQGRVYYAVVRMFNDAGQAAVARSPGVVVEGEPLLPGRVLDGLGPEDIQFQVGPRREALQTALCRSAR
jgi:hypothetical protein